MFLLCAVILRSIILPDQNEDKPFQYAKIKDEDFVRQTTIYLEEKNGAKYPKMYEFIEKYFQDKQLSTGELSRLEEFITHMYFNSFKQKWASFRQSNFLIKIYFFATLIVSIFHFNAVFFANHVPVSSLQVDWSLFIPLNTIGLIVSYVLFIGYLTFSSMLLMVFSSIFGNKKGALVRTYITLDELVKCMKPGGRKTPVNMSSFRNFIGINRRL